MKVTVYGIKNCDAMKKALAWLDRNGIAYAFHDYKKDGVPLDRLEAWARTVGWEALVNTRGPTYRKIPEAERADLTEAKALALLQKYSSAIKRPVVESGAKVLVGFDEKAFAGIAGAIRSR
jgi:Spx/MgsR family transcriptional regulator